jgi:hypothetical protein
MGVGVQFANLLVKGKQAKWHKKSLKYCGLIGSQELAVNKIKPTLFLITTRSIKFIFYKIRHLKNLKPAVRPHCGIFGDSLFNDDLCLWFFL